ncbi:MAG TPA: hypothetical protein V6C65_15205, partial [Allocoleopsis sp.]
MNSQADLRLSDSDSSNYAAIQAPATIGSNYTLTLPDTDGNNGEALISNGSGVLSWTTVATGFNAWDAANGAINAKSGTYDLLLGGNSTASAQFAVVGLAKGTPVASISATTNKNGLALDAANSSLQSLNKSTLTLGGVTTGNIVLDSGSGSIQLSDNTSVTGTLTTTDSLKIQENGGGTDYGTLDVDTLSGNQTYTLSGTGGTIWTSGNDGSGSTLDADTLDGVDSGSFLRSDTTDTFTSGILNIGTGTTLDVNSGSTLDINSTAVSIADDNITLDGASTTLTQTTGALSFVSGGSGNISFNSASNTISFDSTDTTLSASGLTTFASAATLGISATTLNLGNGSPATIGTVSNDNLTLQPNGTGNLVLASDFNSSVLVGTATTPAPLSISGGIGSNASLIVNQTNNGDIFAASSSGITKFSVANDGTIKLFGSTSGFVGIKANATSANNTLVLPNGNGSGSQVLSNDGTGVLSWTTVATGENVWQRSGNNISPTSASYVAIIGGSTPFTNSELTIAGTTPTITIGDGGAEDTMLHFDGSSTDFHLGIDDSDSGKFKIGTGSTLGTNTKVTIDTSGNVGIGTETPSLIAGNYAAIMATGGAQFSSISGAGLAACNSAVDVLKWDAQTKTFDCGSAVGQVRSFVDNTSDSASDSNTSNYWDGTQPNITLNDISNSILVQVSASVANGSNN